LVITLYLGALLNCSSNGINYTEGIFTQTWIGNHLHKLGTSPTKLIFFWGVKEPRGGHTERSDPEGEEVAGKT
jgi:hypothetical protein